jgi:hypothetical protein
MVSYLLVIWLGVVDNFAIVDEFKHEKDCLAKKNTYEKALKQANSEMAVTCRVRYQGK